MKTKNLIAVIALFALSVTAVYAQRIETMLRDGNPVINCDDMPAAAITTTSKGQTAEQLRTEAANATVFHWFAVAKDDNSTASTWSNAFTICSGLGAGWRLPTQRELMLIWVLKAELEKISGFTKFDANIYWSATENSIFSETINFSYGLATSENRSTKYMVRCVREL